MTKISLLDLTIIPLEYHTAVTDIYNDLGAILRVFNCSRRIDTEELESACRAVYQLTLVNSREPKISPTLHKLLAHASGIITDINEGRGVEALSEEGIEACNKQVRRYRDRLS